jgi:peptidoglycan-associated lipoprotein
MRHRVAVLAVLGVAVGLGACRREAPQPPTPAVNEDSIAAVRRAEEEARLRAAEEARLRAEADARNAGAAATARAREILMTPVYFGYDMFELSAEAQSNLQQKVEVLRANPTVSLRIEGHADERGSNEYNLALGMRRANAARQYLVGFGLDDARFTVISFGEERPADPRQTEDAYARNRRAEFQLISGGDIMTVPPALR